MAHRTARLTRIAIDGWPIAKAAAAQGVSRTTAHKWAYGHLYRTNAERLEALPAWTAYYIAERTHTALGGITPMAALLNNLHGNHI